MSNIDLGDSPIGVPPTTEQEFQIRKLLSIPEVNGIISNTQRKCMEKINSWNNASGPPIVLLFAGDSLLTGVNPLDNMCIQGVISSATYTTSGTQTSNTLSDKWLNGKTINIPVGTTAQFSRFGGTNDSFRASKAMITWVAEPDGGAGTFDLQIKKSYDGSWTNLATGLSTFNASAISVSQTYDVPTVSNSPFYQLRVTNITGKPLQLIMWGLYCHNSYGIILVDGPFNQSGRDVTSWLNCPDEILAPALSGLPDINLIFSRWADADFTWGPTNPTPKYIQSSAPSSPSVNDYWLNTSDGKTYNYLSVSLGWQICGAWRTMFDKFLAIKPNIDVVTIGAHCMYSTDNDPNFASYPTWSGSSISYTANQIIKYLNVCYVCLSNHTSSAGTEPGLGGSWKTVWNFYFDPNASRASEISIRASIKAQRDWSKQFRHTFVDVFDLFGSCDEAWNNGLKADYAHLNTVGNKILNNYLNQCLPIAKANLGRLSIVSHGEAGGLTLNLSGPSGFSAIEADKPISIRSTSGQIIFFANNNIDDAGQNWSILNPTGNLSFNQSGAPIVVFGTSLWRGCHPGFDDSTLGGLNSNRWRGSFTGLQTKSTVKTSAYTLTAADSAIWADASTGALVLTLPLASANPDRIFTVKKIDSSANAVSIFGGSQTRSSGATTNSSANITFGSTGTPPPVGSVISGTGIQAGSMVLSSTPTSAVLSLTATATNTNLTFTFTDTIDGATSISSTTQYNKWNLKAVSTASQNGWYLI